MAVKGSKGRRTEDDIIAEIQAGIKADKHRISNLMARKAKKEKALRTRRAFILGEAMLTAWSPDQIEVFVKEHVTKEADRALFGST